jgi:putative inorganic carbon (hco3(-)) transporter
VNRLWASTVHWGFDLSALALVAVAAAVVVVCGAVAQRPQRGVLAVAGLAPYHGLLAVAHAPSVASGWKEGLVVYTAAVALVHRLRRPTPNAPAGMSWLVGTYLWILLGLTSMAASRDIRALIGFKVTYFYLLLVLCQVFAPLAERDRDRLASILMTSGVVTAGYGIVQQLLGPVKLHSLGYPYNTVIRTAGGHLRSFSTFNQPFPFAFFLMTVLLIGLPIALTDAKRPRNRLFLLSTPLLVAGMLSAVVRGAVLGLVVGLLVLAFHRYRSLLLVLSLAAAVVAFSPGTVTSVFFSSTSLVERSQTWSTRLNSVLEAPFGNGIGTTGSAAEKRSGLSDNTGDSLTSLLQGYAAATTDAAGSQASSGVVQPDNSYYVTLYELGILGLWVLILLLTAVVTENLRVAPRAGPRDRPWCEGVAALAAAVAAASLVATYLQIFPDDLLFWLLLGVTAGGQLPKQGFAEPEHRGAMAPVPARS